MKETGKWTHTQEELLYLRELNLGVLPFLPATQLQDKSDQHKLLLAWTVHWGLVFFHHNCS